MFLDVLGEVQASHEQPDKTEAAVKPWKDEHSTQWADIDGTPEGVRRVTLEDNDPAYAVSLKAYVIDCLQRAQGVGLGAYWQKADEGARKSLERFLS